MTDLAQQSKSPTSPRIERSNAFGSFVNVTTEARTQIVPLTQSPHAPTEVPESALADGMSTPPTPTHSGSMHRRLSRKQSRPSMITSDTPHTPWEVELNPSANGSLHNAVASVDHLYKRGKLWIGVLGPSTDDIAPDAYVQFERISNTDPDFQLGGRKFLRPYSQRHRACRFGSQTQSFPEATILIVINSSGLVFIIFSLIDQRAPHRMRVALSLNTRRSTSDLRMRLSRCTNLVISVSRRACDTMTYSCWWPVCS